VVHTQNQSINQVVYVFADDAIDDDNKTLQFALYALQKWSEKWLLNLNINKCQVFVTFGRSVDKSCKYRPYYSRLQ